MANLDTEFLKSISSAIDFIILTNDNNLEFLRNFIKLSKENKLKDIDNLKSVDEISVVIRKIYMMILRLYLDLKNEDLLNTSSYIDYRGEVCNYYEFYYNDMYISPFQDKNGKVGISIVYDNDVIFLPVDKNGIDIINNKFYNNLYQTYRDKIDKLVKVYPINNTCICFDDIKEILDSINYFTSIDKDKIVEKINRRYHKEFIDPIIYLDYIIFISYDREVREKSYMSSLYILKRRVGDKYEFIDDEDLSITDPNILIIHNMIETNILNFLDKESNKNSEENTNDK